MKEPLNPAFELLAKAKGDFRRAHGSQAVENPGKAFQLPRLGAGIRQLLVHEPCIRAFLTFRRRSTFHQRINYGRAIIRQMSCTNGAGHDRGNARHPHQIGQCGAGIGFIAAIKGLLY